MARKTMKALQKHNKKFTLLLTTKKGYGKFLLVKGIHYQISNINDIRSVRL